MIFKSKDCFFATPIEFQVCNFTPHTSNSSIRMNILLFSQQFAVITHPQFVNLIKGSEYLGVLSQQFAVITHPQFMNPIKGSEYLTKHHYYWSSNIVTKQASKDKMPYHRVALFCVALYMLAGFAYCSRCGISQPEQNCLTLWMAFQDSLLNQRSNLLRLDLMFNQPSQLTPPVVKSYLQLQHSWSR